MSCNHEGLASNGNIPQGFYGGSSYCPYCQPRCPCCGRPYYGGWNYPVYPYQPIPYNPITCNTGEAKEPTQ